MKILWFDTETTGLESSRNGMIQLAMLMDIDGEVVDEIQANIQPFDSDMMSIGIADVENDPQDISWQESKEAYEDAITPTGIKINDIRKFLYPQLALAKINAFLQKHISKFDKTDKAYIGGYNIPFDIAFLSKFYEKCGDKYLGSYINWRHIDVRSMLYLANYHGKISLEHYKLETVCKYFSIELEAHNPMSDIKTTREIFYRLEGGEL
jgi:DNA polymerase III alpha subunit (gram-positive type)